MSYQIYIQTILKFINKAMLAALLSFILSSKVSKTTPNPHFYDLCTFKAESPGKKQDVNLKL